MPISHSDQVFSLVKSLNKSEKRNFRLYAGRIVERNSLLYLKLFDIYDKQVNLQERDILKKMGGISRTQYSNLKRHLYSQILTSLRSLHKEKKAYIKIGEYIDFSYILYDKGLYMPALKILDKAKKLALKTHTDLSALNIVEIEKMIQSRHITRTNTASIEALVSEASQMGFAISNRINISNLKVLLHRYYIRKGHVSNATEEKEIKSFFNKNLPDIDAEKLGPMEKVHLYQCYVWYYYILNNFKKCYEFAQKWVRVIETNQEILKNDVGLYLRGNHYLLTAAYNNRALKPFTKHLKRLEKFRHDEYASFNENTKIASFLSVHFARMNQHFLMGTFDQGTKDITRTLSRMTRYKMYLDEHKQMVLNFKIAWMYYGNNMPAKANEYLLKIINLSSQSLREDIQIYARLLHLMLHIDSDDFSMILYLVKNYDSFMSSTKDKNKVQANALKMFKELAKAPLLDRKAIYINYLRILTELENDKYSRRAFLYLDINSWIRSKISLTPIAEIIQNKNIS